MTIQVGRAGQGARKLALKLVPGTKNVFEGAMPQAAEGDYEVRLLPPPVLEGPIPTTTFRVDAPINEFEHIEMNGPELLRAAESTGGKFYTPLVADALAPGLAQAVEGSARYRSADSALEHLAGAGAVPDVAHAWSGFSGNANKWYDSCLVDHCRTQVVSRTDQIECEHIDLRPVYPEPGGRGDSSVSLNRGSRGCATHSGGCWLSTGSPGWSAWWCRW